MKLTKRYYKLLGVKRLPRKEKKRLKRVAAVIEPVIEVIWGCLDSYEKHFSAVQRNSLEELIDDGIAFKDILV